MEFTPIFVKTDELPNYLVVPTKGDILRYVPERTCQMTTTWINGNPVGQCQLCGAVEWDWDPDDPWEYCHGCGAKVVK